MILKNVGVGLFVATTTGMLSYALTFAESMMQAFVLLSASLGLYISIKEHIKELNDTGVTGS